MANKARDLSFSILSDASKFDAAEPARDLDKLADSADDAGASLEDLERARERVDLDRLGTDASDTARKVDTAFDKIARSSKESARKVDDASDSSRASIRDIGDEAGDTGREMAHSFDGTKDGILDSFQELAAEAGVKFGPIGVAAGIAAGVGVGLIRAEAEKLKVIASGFVEDMLDAGGKLTAAAVDAKINAAATEDPGAFAAEKDKVEALGVTWRDYIRAKNGDGAASKKVMAQLAELNTVISDNAEKAGSASGVMYAQQTALNELAGELSGTATAYDLAAEATGAATSATGESKDSLDNAKNAWRELKGAVKDPAVATVKVKAPTRSDLVEVRQNMLRGIGTLVVPVRPGQTIHSNTADNSRYRE